MSVSEFNNSAAVAKAVEASGPSSILPQAALKHEGEGHAQADKPAGEPPAKVGLTAGGVSRFLQGISTSSCGEIDTLIGDLRVLREKLVGDGDRIERDLVEFATLNQSVIKLTEVVMDSVTHVKAPGRRK